MNILDLLVNGNEINKLLVNIDKKTLMYLLIGGLAGCGAVLIAKHLIENNKSNVSDEMINTLLFTLANSKQTLNDVKKA